MGILTAATFIPKAHIFELRRLHLEYQIGLLSNFDDSQTVKRILESVEIDQLFKSIVISENIGVQSFKIPHRIDIPYDKNPHPVNLTVQELETEKKKLESFSVV